MTVAHHALFIGPQAPSTGLDGRAPGLLEACTVLFGTSACMLQHW